MKSQDSLPTADICMILEGTYPYVSGGVASWTHNLIQQQSPLTFHLVCILPPFSKLKKVYELPKNVIGLTNIYLQELPEGATHASSEKILDLFKKIELPLLKLQHYGRLQDFKVLVDAFGLFHEPLGSAILMESEEAWEMTLRIYRATMGDSSFLNFYFSWKGLISSFYSILLASIPPARVYHAVSTGYAGLFLVKAHLKTKRPGIITEHGIYTNERRIEITLADWLYDQKTMNLAIDVTSLNRDLKDFWIDTFFGYSKLCYDACDKIITLFQGNQEYQIADGADPAKLLVIPNGVDISTYGAIEKVKGPPTIALIGRVVPIKDIKSFIHAVSLLKDKIPGIQAFVMGPIDEDHDYYEECVELVANLNLKETVTFTGKVKTNEYLPKIDVIVLTSISESQPLTILEAGAAGIPCVATDAGSCEELILGRNDENPRLGAGGVVVPPSNPSAVAEGIALLLLDENYYKECSHAMRERVKKYYNEVDVTREYRTLYNNLMEKPSEDSDFSF